MADPSYIADGDVLLFESTGWVARTIRWATRSRRFSHAALAARWGDAVMVLESREGRGCRAIPLAAALRVARVYLFKPAAWVTLDRARAVEAAKGRLGDSYGWRHVLLDGAGRLPLMALAGSLGLLGKIPVIGGFLRRIPFGQAYSNDDLEDPGHAVKCSTYVALAWRAGGQDLVPNLADRSTDPADIERSLALVEVGLLPG